MGITDIQAFLDIILTKKKTKKKNIILFVALRDAEGVGEDGSENVGGSPSDPAKVPSLSTN